MLDERDRSGSRKKVKKNIYFVWHKNTLNNNFECNRTRKRANDGIIVYWICVHDNNSRRAYVSMFDDDNEK